MKNIIIIILLIFITWLLLDYQSDEQKKQFVIDNAPRLECVDKNRYEIVSLAGYYTDVTVVLGDSVYTLVYWGDRESILWYIYGDKVIKADIPYKRYHGENVRKDVQLYEAVKKQEKRDCCHEK